MKDTFRYLRYAAAMAAGSLAASLLAADSSVSAAPAPAAPVVPYAPVAPAATSLRGTFKGIFHVGVAVRPDQVNGQTPQSAALILREFDCISPENVMKVGPIHPRAGNEDSSYNFGPADEYVDFGVKNHLFVIGHNLCWHSQLPAWMSQPDPGQESLTREVLMARLHDHIMKVVGRYKGRVNGWDVVNEAINDGAGGYRQSVFYRVIGKEYLAMAFKWAHEADPNAELYYNDYNLDANDAKRATALELVHYLKEQDAPITGVGLQGHYNLTTPPIAKIDETIGLFAALGLKVHITELDVTVIRGASVSGAVGFNPTAPNATQPAGGRGPGRGGLPAIEALKTSVRLTDAQVAAITPILDHASKEVAAAVGAGDFAKIAQIRTDLLAALRKQVNEDQQGALVTALTPVGRGPAGPPPVLTPEQQREQAQRYGEIFAVFMKHRDAVARVTFWGLRDADSWRRQNSPLIFDDKYGRKPAYDAVIDAARVTGAAAKP